MAAFWASYTAKLAKDDELLEEASAHLQSVADDEATVDRVAELALLMDDAITREDLDAAAFAALIKETEEQDTRDAQAGDQSQGQPWALSRRFRNGRQVVGCHRRREIERRR